MICLYQSIIKTITQSTPVLHSIGHVKWKDELTVEYFCAHCQKKFSISLSKSADSLKCEITNTYIPVQRCDTPLPFLCENAKFMNGIEIYR